MKETNPENFYRSMVLPQYETGLRETGMISAVSNLIKNFNAGDSAGMRKTLEGIRDHLQDVSGKVESNKVAAETARTEKVTAETRSNLEAEMGIDSKKALGAALSPHLRNSFLGPMISEDRRVG